MNTVNVNDPRYKAYNPGDTIKGLTFLRETAPHVCKNKRRSINRKAIFRCHCGKEFECTIGGVNHGTTTSCGCHRRKVLMIAQTKHNLSRIGQVHPLYRRWLSIKARCYNPNRKDYYYYGGAGISLSEEFHDPVAFFNYASGLDRYEERKDFNLSIDRIDTLGNYERGNIRWATKSRQRYNQRHHEPSTFLRMVVKYMELFKTS